MRFVSLHVTRFHGDEKPAECFVGSDPLAAGSADCRATHSQSKLKLQMRSFLFLRAPTANHSSWNNRTRQSEPREREWKSMRERERVERFSHSPSIWQGKIREFCLPGHAQLPGEQETAEFRGQRGCHQQPGCQKTHRGARLLQTRIFDLPALSGHGLGRTSGSCRKSRWQSSLKKKRFTDGPSSHGLGASSA